MNFAVVQQVTVVGVMFAVAMMVGIGITLSIVALVSVVFRERVASLMNGRPGLLEKISRGLEVIVGVNLMVVALAQVVDDPVKPGRGNKKKPRTNPEPF